MPSILVIDDEAAIRETLKEILTYEKYEVTVAEDGTKGLQLLQKNNYDVILSDVKMPGIDGMELLDRVQAIAPDTPMVMISGHGTVEMAIEATKKGAYDFITKPPDLNRLLITLRNAVDRNNLVSETKVLKRKASKTYDIIGETPAITKIKETIEKVAPTEARVLVTVKSFPPQAGH
jgi:DNA-binding NtrC family response regulator